MNVLFIPISVLLSYNEYLINGLQELGTHVYVDKPGPMLSNVMYVYEKMQRRLKGTLLPTFIMPSVLREAYLKRLLRSRLVDVIHLNCMNITLNVLKIAKEMGVPLIFVLHTAPIPKIVYEQIDDFVNVYVSPSNFTLEVEKGKINVRKAVVIYHGIDVREFKRRPVINARAEFKLPPNRKIVLWNDRISPEKDLRTLLEAIPLVLREFRDVLFYIKARAIIWNYYSKIKSFIENPMVRSFIKLHVGWMKHKDLPTLYSAADIFVRTSLYENFGLGYVEAMACGTPVVASNTATAPEVVGDAGLFFKPRDPSDLADKIVKVLSEDELRRDLSIKAIKRVNVHFRHDIMAKEYYKIYSKLLN